MSTCFYFYSNTPIPDDTSVCFASSFLDWKQIDTTRKSSQTYEAKFDNKKYQISGGPKVQYKFIVDGVWRLSDDKSLPTG